MRGEAILKPKELLVRLAGFEPATCCSGGSPVPLHRFSISHLFCHFLSFGGSAFAQKLTPLPSIRGFLVHFWYGRSSAHVVPPTVLPLVCLDVSRLAYMPLTFGLVEDRTVRWPDPSPPAPVGDILPRLTLTKRRLKQLELIQLVREQREARKQELAFTARPFVLCGLPLRPLPKHQLLYKRRNGNFFLHILGHPDFGLPTVRADCTCAPFAFGMGRNLPSLPPAAGSAI